MSDEKYSRCPDCGCKTVYWRGLPNGEDNYRCRRSSCDFYFFTSGEAEVDLKNAARWKAAQPTGSSSAGQEGP